MEKKEKETYQQEPILHSFAAETQQKAVSELHFKKSLGIFLLVIVLGLVSGFGLAFFTKKAPSKQKGTTAAAPAEKKAGVEDKKTFKDTAEGILKEGGIEGEGHFHLERPGGSSQNVYLTSTTVDLLKYIDQKVKVQGETYSAEKAGWLMDVGLIEVVN